MLGIREYIHNNKAPFSEWLNKLDRSVKARVMTRIDRIRRGNFGDTKSVGEGVFELRIAFGPGYRVYYARQGQEIVILLCGGDKGSQPRDIARAKELWRDVNRSADHGNQTL